jgi:hypothetical protein
MSTTSQMSAVLAYIFIILYKRKIMKTKLVIIVLAFSGLAWRALGRNLLQQKSLNSVKCNNLSLLKFHYSPS